MCDMLLDLIRKVPGPRYRAIIDVVSDEVMSGRLSAGDRLPTHRDMARHLGLNVGTVSRAYAELRRLGVISGETGRGTFVAELVPDAPPSISQAQAAVPFIDLSHNFPLGAPCNPKVMQGVELVVAGGGIDDLMTHQVDLGQARHRDAGRDWLEFQGLHDVGGEIAVTAGGQHGLLLALAALTRPGDRVMTEAVTYFGLRSAASLLGLEFLPMAIDEEGLIPERLEEACHKTGAKVLCCSPTLHNPTTAVMSEGRRREIAEICRRAEIHIIEDDVYSFLLEPRIPPICSFAPDHTFYVTSVSKCVGPGLRVGFLRFPHEYAEKVGLSIRATTLMAPTLTAEIVMRMIQSGAIFQIADDQREEMTSRQEIVAKLLGKHDVQRHPQSFHIWLHMTNGWSSREFVSEARRHGIGVAPGEIFSMSALEQPNSVRVCISAAQSRDHLRKALSILRRILSAPAHAASSARKENLNLSSEVRR